MRTIQSPRVRRVEKSDVDIKNEEVKHYDEENKSYPNI